MKAAGEFFIHVLTLIGMFAAAMFVMGYIYASLPMVKVRTCQPSITDRIFR